MIVLLWKPTNPLCPTKQRDSGIFQIQELGANNISVFLVSQIEAKLSTYAKYLTIGFRVALVNDLNGIVPGKKVRK